MIRTRFSVNVIDNKSNDDLFKRAPVGITQERVKSSLKHQMITSERILEKLKKPLTLLEEECLPVHNEMICKNCPFQDPCIAMDEGMSADKALGANYVPKTSGFQIEARTTDA
jgi:hypothetical protein